MRRMWLPVVAMALLASAAARTQGQNTTDIYFIDTEGGQATLIISPVNGILGTKETLLLDAGNLNPPGRDAERIVAAMKDAGVEWIDTLVVSHYHGDHVGGVAALADKVPIRRALDPGAFIPEQNANREAGYLSYVPIRQNSHVVTPEARDEDSGARSRGSRGVVRRRFADGSSSRCSPANNPLCSNAQRRAQDPTPNNAESIDVVVEFGRFRYLDLADLTWNQEMELVCPANLLGNVAVYRTSRHGTEWSGAQAPCIACMATSRRHEQQPDQGWRARDVSDCQELPGARGLLAAPLLGQRRQRGQFARAVHRELHRER